VRFLELGAVSRSRRRSPPLGFSLFFFLLYCFVVERTTVAGTTERPEITANAAK